MNNFGFFYMKIKIIRANISGVEGLKILKPSNMVINVKDLEKYRQALKENEDDNVLFIFEEIEKDLMKKKLFHRKKL